MRVRCLALLFFLVLGLGRSTARAERIKDIADLEGARSNQLIGYGLVVGLSGTGDDTTAPMSGQSIVTMLQRLGAHIEPARLRLRNVAAVIVTAELPAFVAPGSKVDVTVSSIGNAASLEGGTLLAAPLKGSDLKVYAVAQGPLSVGGYLVSGTTGSRSQKNHPTVGRVPNGALIERSVNQALTKERLQLQLRRPDFTTASRVVEAIQKKLSEMPNESAGATESEENSNKPSAETPPPPSVLAKDAAVVQIVVPKNYHDRVAAFVAEIENLEVTSDAPTRVVVNERTGTVVLGEGVRLSPVAIAHGGLTLEVREQPIVVQPQAFAKGKTAVVPSSNVSAQEKGGELRELSGSASLGDVVKALNALGVSPRDLVSILQALKSSGSLRAELEIQ